LPNVTQLIFFMTHHRFARARKPHSVAETAQTIVEPDLMSNDPLIVFTPSGKRGHFPAGTPILTAARQLGVDLESVCGGRGICSKCQITPSYGEFPKHGLTASEGALSEWNAVEQRYDDKRGLKPGRRLGCQATLQGDMVIDVPEESQVHKQVIRKAASDRVITMDPATKLYFIEVEEPDMHVPTGDLERVARALQEQWGVPAITASLPVLSKLQPVLRRGKWQITVALNTDASGSAARMLDVWPGLYEGGLYGLAIDLGSTTVAAHLCDLVTGEVKASSGLMNPQIRFGEDLMSRVSYAMMNPGGDAEMTSAVRGAINDLARGSGPLCAGHVRQPQPRCTRAGPDRDERRRPHLYPAVYRRARGRGCCRCGPVRTTRRVRRPRAGCRCWHECGNDQRRARCHQ